MSISGNDSCEKLYTYTTVRRRDMIVKIVGWRNEEVSDDLFWKGAREQTSFLLSYFLQEG